MYAACIKFWLIVVFNVRRKRKRCTCLYRRRRRLANISIAPESQSIVCNHMRVEGVGWMQSANGLLSPYYVARSTIHALGTNRQKNCASKNNGEAAPPMPTWPQQHNQLCSTDSRRTDSACLLPFRSDELTCTWAVARILLSMGHGFDLLFPFLPHSYEEEMIRIWNELGGISKPCCIPHNYIIRRKYSH